MDNTSTLNSVIFAAADFDRIPKYGPEELNICVIADKQCEMEARISTLTNIGGSRLNQDCGPNKNLDVSVFKCFKKVHF